MIASEAIAFLATAGVGTSAVTLFADDLSSTVEECLSVQDYPGRAPDYALGQATPTLEHFRAQVKARGATKAAGRVLIRAAYNAFATVRNQTVGSGFWLIARPLQQPYRYEVDAKGRTVYAFNVEITKRR